MTLLLRCIRCGTLHDMDPLGTDALGLCACCRWKRPGLRIVGHVWDARALQRWDRRWQKHQERHPTYKALSAALSSLESVPHGTLAEVD